MPSSLILIFVVNKSFMNLGYIDINSNASEKGIGDVELLEDFQEMSIMSLLVLIC